MAVSASEIDIHVGRRMRQRREALSLSQGRLGQHVGITFSQVQKYEKGANRIGAGRLFLLADVLGVDVQYFYEGLGEETTRAMDRTGDPEMTALGEAFMSISDPSTRRSVLALVCSLAGADPGAVAQLAHGDDDTVRAFRHRHRNSAAGDHDPAPNRASS